MNDPKTGVESAEVADQQNKETGAVGKTETETAGKKADDATAGKGEGNTEGGKAEDGAGKTDASDDAKARNAEAARQRRERETKERIDKAVAEALKKQESESELKYVRTYIKVNKFTNEPINDRDDLETYKTMLEMEEKGLNPTDDYAKYVTEKRRAERAKSESAEKADEEYFRLDTEMLVEAYGKDGARKILDDKEFMSYFEKISEGKRISILAAKAKYDRENAENGKKAASEAAAQEAKKAVARAIAAEQSATGKVGSSDTAAKEEFYTLEQLRTMSRADIEKNWEKVKKSYEKQVKK